MYDPLVSVIIPVYNAEGWIRATLESVLSQTWPRIEPIVVDDGSSDGSADVARSFADRGVRLVRQSNRGASAARNRGLAEATGQFVQYLDADDLLSHDKIERQVRLLTGSNRSLVAVCDTVYFRDGEEPERGYRSIGGPYLDSDEPVQWLIDLWTPGPGYGTTRWGMVQPGAWLTPIELISAVGPWDEHPSPDDDGEYFSRVLVLSDGVRWESDGCVYYRQFGGIGASLSGQRSRLYMEGRLRSVEGKVAAVLPRTTVDNMSQARCALARQFMDVAFHAYPAFPDLVRRAEENADALGGYSAPFFAHSRSGTLVERVLGWKAARQLSRIAHARRGA